MYNNILKCCSCELSFETFASSLFLWLTLPLIKYTQPTCYVSYLLFHFIFPTISIQLSSLLQNNLPSPFLQVQLCTSFESPSSKHILNLKVSREDESIKKNQWTKKPSITTFFPLQKLSSVANANIYCFLLLYRKGNNKKLTIPKLKKNWFSED